MHVSVTISEKLPSVVVMPNPRPPSHLNATQAKNCRRVADGEGVMRPQMICRPVGLGMVSTVKTIPMHIIPTHNSAPGTVRPGNRRRGHARAGANTCFSNRFVTHRQEHNRTAQHVLERLRKLHLQVILAPGNTRLISTYRYSRWSALVNYPELTPELPRIEREHRLCVKPMGVIRH